MHKKKAGKLQTGSTFPKQYWLAVNGKPKKNLHDMPHARHPHGGKRRGREKNSKKGVSTAGHACFHHIKMQKHKRNAGLAMVSAPRPVCQNRRCAQIHFNKRRLMYEL